MSMWNTSVPVEFTLSGLIYSFSWCILLSPKWLKRSFSYSYKHGPALRLTSVKHFLRDDGISPSKTCRTASISSLAAHPPKSLANRLKRSDNKQETNRQHFITKAEQSIQEVMWPPQVKIPHLRTRSQRLSLRFSLSGVKAETISDRL